MDAWSLMRGDAFIHFVSGSRRVNIRLGVLLLIPKSPQTAQGFHWSRRPDSSSRRRRKIASLSAKNPISGLLRKSYQTPPETAQCRRHNYQPLNLTALFRSNSENEILFETTPAATFLHRRPLHCSGNYHSCTGDHLTAAATATPAPAATSLQKQLPVLHQQLPVLHQRPPSCISRHQRPLSCISRHQQLIVLDQRPLSCTSRYQQLSVLDQRTPSCTGRYQS